MTASAKFYLKKRLSRVRFFPSLSNIPEGSSISSPSEITRLSFLLFVLESFFIQWVRDLYYFSGRGQIIIWGLFFTLYFIEQSLAWLTKWVYSLMFEVFVIFTWFLIRFIQQTLVIYFFAGWCYRSFSGFIDEASEVKTIDFWRSAIIFQLITLEIHLNLYLFSSPLLFLGNTHHLFFVMPSLIKSGRSAAFFILNLFFEHFSSNFLFFISSWPLIFLIRSQSFWRPRFPKSSIIFTVGLWWSPSTLFLFGFGQ